MTAPAYRVAVWTATPAIAERKLAFWEALQSLGHTVRIFHGPRLADMLQEFRPDFLALTCVDYTSLHTSRLASVLDTYPYVTLWDSTPLRTLYFLNIATEHHLAIFAHDTQIVADLHALGITQARYFPYYYADPRVFRPQPASAAFVHKLAFAGTFCPPTRIKQIWPHTGREGGGNHGPQCSTPS